MVYIGVDLHPKTTQVAAVNGGGELLVSRKVPTSGPHILPGTTGRGLLSGILRI